MAFVYILFSPSRKKTYVGFTEREPDIRLAEHLDGDTATTQGRKDWEMVWTANFSSIELAKEFERYLKSHSGRAFMSKRLLGDLAKTINSR